MSVAANINPLGSRRKIRDAIADDPMSLADAYEMSKRPDEKDASQTMWYFRDQYYFWQGGAYTVKEPRQIHRDLYRFLRGRKVLGPDGNRICKPDQKLVGKVLDALNAVCELFVDDMPGWIGDEAANPPIHADDVLAFKNGLLNLDAYLRDGDATLLPPTPAWFSTQVFPYNFSRGVACPAWLTFLAQVFDGDQQRIDLLQEWFGYCLTRDTTHHKIMLMVGLPRSGKSTILHVLSAVVNKDNVAAPKLRHLAGDFALQDLIGKSVAVISDAHIGKNTDPIEVLEELKRISGGDYSDVRRKHLPALSNVRFWVRFTIACNQILDLPDASNAIVDRLVALRFGKTFKGKEDRSLLARLMTEIPGVLLWSIEGLARLRETDKFTMPDDSAQLIGEISRSTSPVRAFLDDECILAGGDEAAALGLQEIDFETEVDQIWARWQWWTKKYGFREGTRDSLGKRLKAVLPFLEKPRKRDGPERWHVYSGIRLRDPPLDYVAPSSQSGFSPGKEDPTLIDML